MKIFATTVLVLLFTVTPMGVMAADEHGSPENTASTLSSSESRHVVEPDPQQATSVLDLSLVGIVALGVFGLFWIRRHTSEL